MNIQNIRISTRLGLGFGLMVLLLVVMGGSSLLKMRSVEASIDAVIADRYDKIHRLGELKDELNLIVRSGRNALLVSEASEAAKLLKQMAETNRAMDTGEKELAERVAADARGRELVAALLRTSERHDALMNKFIAAMEAGNKDEGRRITLAELRPVQLDYDTQVTAAADHEREQMAVAAQAAADSVSAMRVMIWTSLVLATVIAVLLALWIIRSVSRPLNRALDVSRAVAAGDLSLEIKDAGRNEMGLLLSALGHMQASLASVVSGVRQNADLVATASTQISQGNNDLSSRTEEQASALQQTAASMKQLAATVRQNADNARQGNELAQTASTVAARGGDVVGQVVETMKGINDSSRKIADILSVIDGIAFQTNILALNAAVEAARAGEQGRGFAVVAGEVRTLAQRSADAAKEIKTLITASVERVEQGSALVDQAGATMSEVVASIRRVTDLMGEISAASSEQSVGVGQIGEAVQQMDQATQQNAALVEESAAAADSLKSQAQQLVGSVAVFKLHAGEPSTVLSLPAPPAANSPTVHRPDFRRPAPAPRIPRPAPAPARTGTDDEDWQTF